MDKESSDLLINDHFFHQVITCPLKMDFLLGNDELFSGRPVYRQRNKLNLRDAVAVRFPNLFHTSDEYEKALGESESWLKKDQVSICGAVIKSGSFVTRIPILVKHGKSFTIIQVHGKLRKSSERATIEKAGEKHTTSGYLLKAAYRYEILKRAFPGAKISVEFYFPIREFRSSVDGLNRFRLADLGKKDEIFQNLDNLFSAVDATTGTCHARDRLPGLNVHSVFSDQSIESSLAMILQMTGKPGMRKVDRHSGCKYCEFRQSNGEKPGCWQNNFSEEDIRFPEKHIFELIGHGNPLLAEKNIYYTEQAEINDGWNSFDLMKEHGGPVFSVQQRRNLAILNTRNEPVPLLWAKEGILQLRDFQYPLHFMDFEAATYALPLKRGKRPYEPVYFQFSCHTLLKDGSLHHTEWIDLEKENHDPHKKVIEELSLIPMIKQGTIVQYSPFEKQAINNLIREFQKNSMLYEMQIQTLEKIRDGNDRRYPVRFLDLNDLIRSYYYNCFLDDGLGLKNVLDSIVRWEGEYGEMLNSEKDKNQTDSYTHLRDAYLHIQDNGTEIMDGSAAMNAWLAMKNDLLKSTEEFTIPGVLKKYCGLDSFAMVMIFRHLIRVAQKMEEKEVIITGTTSSK